MWHFQLHISVYRILSDACVQFENYLNGCYECKIVHRKNFFQIFLLVQFIKIKSDECAVSYVQKSFINENSFCQLVVLTWFCSFCGSIIQKWHFLLKSRQLIYSKKVWQDLQMHL